MKIDVPYGITKRLPDTSLADARARVTEALKEEGFGVLTEIDVQATLEKKLGVTTDPYVILGACNPRLAHRALGADPGIGLLLPCNVVVTTDGGDAIVSAASPRAMFAAVAPSEAIAAIAAEAETRLRAAMDRLE
jgi:uncharacterized protein (DUF302 family)